MTARDGCFWPETDQGFRVGNGTETEVGTIAEHKRTPPAVARLREVAEASLDDDKAQDVVVIDLAGKTTFADFMVVATGQSQRHVGAMANHLIEKFKAEGLQSVPAEGMPKSDWVLLDAGDVIVHLFRPEARAFYNLEKMWRQHIPEPESGAELSA